MNFINKLVFDFSGFFNESCLKIVELAYQHFGATVQLCSKISLWSPPRSWYPSRRRLFTHADNG